MSPHNRIARDEHPAVTTLRPGHRIREIRQQLHDRHPVRGRYQVALDHHLQAGPVAATSDEYQARLYTKSRSGDLRVRLAALREAIATSPYVWDDLAADGVREWVESSIEDDALLAAAAVSLGALSAQERRYFGKFTAERIYEMLMDAEETYWHKYFRRRPP